MIYSDWLAEWMRVYKKTTLTAKSFERLECVIKKVPKNILQKDISLITVFELDSVISRIPSGRSAKYMRHLFKNSFHKAYCLDMIKNDISTKLAPVRYKPVMGSALSSTEIYSFLNKIKNTVYRDFFEFLLFSGCRRSEALALTWSHIDFDNNLIHIPGTKTVNSDRVLPLLPDMRNVLERVRGGCLMGERSRSPTARTPATVFPFKPDTVSHAFKKFCPAHKLHDLRHTFITCCARAGLKLKVVSKFVGHSDILTTYRIYTHVFSDEESLEMSRLNIIKKDQV